MKLSIFTTITNPEKRGDDWRDALKCYTELADEVVVVDGSPSLITVFPGTKQIWSKWPYKFDWPFIGEQFQRGYEACTGDWVIHMDIDWILHENDFQRIRETLLMYDDHPAVSFWKYQFILPDRFNIKSRPVVAVNKGRFGNRIKFNSGGDLCQPSLDGKYISADDVPESRIALYNYEKMTKNKSQIRDDAERMEDAYFRYFGERLYTHDGRTPYEGITDMLVRRFNKPQRPINIEDHPLVVQDTIRNLMPNQWGYNGLGKLVKNSYVKGG